MIWIINGKRFKNNFSILKDRITEDDEYYHLHNPLSPFFGKNDDSWKNEFNFSWNRCHRSWNEVQRHVFIDFGDENLFRVKVGMGTSNGKGKSITKQEFIVKYGGDTEFLATLIDKTN